MRLKYRVLRPLVNTRTGVRYAPGDPIYLSHETARLLAGRVEEWEGPADDLAGVAAVNGIGPERARALGRIGIVTLHQLAGADATAVERKIPALTVGQIKRWQEQAKTLLNEEKREDDKRNKA